MKKSVVIILLLVSCSLASFSQTGVYSGGIGSNEPQELRKTGLMIRPEIGINIWEVEEIFMPIVVNVGYQLTPCFFIGGGMAFDVDFSSIRRYNPETGVSRLYRSCLIPFYVNPRWYWFKGPSSPFLELNVGANLSKEPSWDSSFWIGWYCQPAIGFDIKNFDIKIWGEIGRIYSQYYGIGIGFGASIGYGFLLNSD